MTAPDGLTVVMGGDKGAGLTPVQSFIDASVAWEKAQQSDDVLKRDTAQARYLRALAKVQAARGEDGSAELAQAARLAGFVKSLKPMAEARKTEAAEFIEVHEAFAVDARNRYPKFSLGWKAWVQVLKASTSGTRSERRSAIESALAVSRRIELAGPQPTPVKAAVPEPAPQAPPPPASAPVEPAPTPTPVRESSARHSRSDVRRHRRSRPADRKAENKALAAELRALGFVPNGEVWQRAKALRADGTVITAEALVAF